MDRYQLIRGFDTYESAKAYAERLPKHAKAKVVPYSTGPGAHAFAVDVHRDYVGGRGACFAFQ